jgi:hypothetical protein
MDMDLDPDRAILYTSYKETTFKNVIKLILVFTFVLEGKSFNVRRVGFHEQHGFHVMPVVSMDEIQSNLKNEGGEDNNIRSLNLLEGPKYSILVAIILL